MFINPKSVIDELDLSGSEIVVDLGAGGGAYTIELAKRIAKGGGKVFAVDIQQDVLTRLAHTAKEEGLTNISYLHADFERPNGVQIQPGLASLTILSNVLYSATNKRAVMQEAARLTHPGGHLLMIDWKGAFKGMGPEKSQVVTENDGVRLAMDNGFSLDRELSSAPHHWAILVRRNIGNAFASELPPI